MIFPPNVHPPFRFYRLCLSLVRLEPSSLSPTASRFKELEESLGATPIFIPQRTSTTLTKILDLETDKCVRTFSGQLGRDVPVAPVPLAALHGLAGRRRGLTGHLSLLIDLEAAFLVDMEAIIYAQ